MGLKSLISIFGKGLNEPFFRVENGIESAVPGTGLGLAISS